MSWDKSTRKARLPADWPAIRRRILRRDGHRCCKIEWDGRRCTRSATDVDHVVNNDDHSDENLQSLCTYHHRKKTNAESNAAQRDKPQRFSSKHPSEPHPGMR